MPTRKWFVAAVQPQSEQTAMERMKCRIAELLLICFAMAGMMSVVSTNASAQDRYGRKFAESHFSPKPHRSSNAIQFVTQWGREGSRDGEFHSPIGIAISKDDVIYITDLNNARVQKFSPEGKYLGEFPLPNDTPNHPDKVHSQAPGIAIAENGLIYVSFMLQHKIAVYSDSGKLVEEWGRHGKADGELNGPGGLVLGTENEIYVADQRNHRVQVFTTEGRFLRSFGQHGSENGQFGGVEKAGSRFGGPHFIALDSIGRLFTTEGTNGRVQRFSTIDEVETSWGKPDDQPGGFGALETEFSKNAFGPIAVMVDQMDRVWVSSLNDRVQAFTTDGEFLFGIGSTGDDPGQFFRPHGMATDSKGFLYLVDSSNQRIQKFRINFKSSGTRHER